MAEHQLLQARVVLGGSLDENRGRRCVGDSPGDETCRCGRMMPDPEELDHAVILPEVPDFSGQSGELRRRRPPEC